MELLKQSLQVKHLTLKNRLVMPPMATSQAKDGAVTRELIDYYAEKTKGGYLGLVITEHSYISPEGKSDPGQVSVSRDSDIAGLRSLAETIHQNGTAAFVQINHAGFTADSHVTGYAPLCVSKAGYEAMTGKTGNSLHEISCSNIKRIVRCYADAARRVKEAGFDGVELHSAHGFLLNQFYSPLSNQRDDAYGGNLQRRIAIHLETIKAVREAVGEDFIVALRLGASDYCTGGSTLDDSVEAAMIFETAGIDLLDISGGFCYYTRPGHREPGYFDELTEAIKKNVSIPVILTGGIKKREDAERLLYENKADLIGIGRGLLADSDLPQKIMA